MDGSREEFGKWRRRLWPFHGYEIKKLLPLILIKFLISVNYCILFCLKETITVTSRGSGAEAFPVLKGIVVLPAAIIAALCYSKLSSIVKKSSLFYITICSFLFIIALYAFVLSPNESSLAPNQFSDWLISIVGDSHSHWVAVVRNWIHSLFFATAELWGSVVIIVVFWSFANDITSVDEAKRSYVIYIAAGDLAAASVGHFIKWLSINLSNYPFLVTVQALTSLAILIGFLVIAIYWWMNRYVLTDSRYYSPKPIEPVKKVKTKLSFGQGMKHLISSPYLLGITMLVIGYGFCISLVEVSWKATVKNAFPNPSDHQAFMGQCQSLVGIFSFIIAAFLGSSLLRKFGWRAIAQLTPFIVGGAGILFLSMIANPQIVNSAANLLSLSPLMILVTFGALHNILSKVAKYSFFDPTKEMAYIPLSESEKVKGKAAIDIVGSRFGKSGSSWVQLALIDLVGSGSVLSVAHLLTPIVFIVTLAWIYAVRSLSKNFLKKGQENLEAELLLN